MKPLKWFFLSPLIFDPLNFSQIHMKKYEEVFQVLCIHLPEEGVPRCSVTLLTNAGGSGDRKVL